MICQMLGHFPHLTHGFPVPFLGNYKVHVASLISNPMNFFLTPCHPQSSLILMALDTVCVLMTPSYSSSSGFSSEIHTSIFSCLFSLSLTWLTLRHLKLNFSKFIYCFFELPLANLLHFSKWYHQPFKCAIYLSHPFIYSIKSYSFYLQDISWICLLLNIPSAANPSQCIIPFSLDDCRSVHQASICSCILSTHSIHREHVCKLLGFYVHILSLFSSLKYFRGFLFSRRMLFKIFCMFNKGLAWSGSLSLSGLPPATLPFVHWACHTGLALFWGYQAPSCLRVYTYSPIYFEHSQHPSPISIYPLECDRRHNKIKYNSLSLRAHGLIRDLCCAVLSCSVMSNSLWLHGL